MTKTTIEWADEVWNPVTGCTKVSAGCKNCYAERIAGRFWGSRKFGDIQIHPDRLEDPYHWKKPRRVFVNSMSDLFHSEVPDHFIDQVFVAMKMAYNHTFLILTKRPNRMLSWFKRWTNGEWDTPGIIIHEAEAKYGKSSTSSQYQWPLKNVWLGVSVEDQKTADERIPLLLQTPAAVRFVSIEPMLGPVKLQGWDGNFSRHYLNHDFIEDKATRGPLDWVICGGESGPGARPVHPDWVRSIRDQCQMAQVPFLFKQWGEWLGTYPDDPKPEGKLDCYIWNGGIASWRLGKKKAGRLFDGVEWNQYPEVKK